MSIPPVDPPNPQQTDAAAGSVFAGDGTSMTRPTPRLGSRLSRPDMIFFGALALVCIVVLVLTLVL